MGLTFGHRRNLCLLFFLEGCYIISTQYTKPIFTVTNITPPTPSQKIVFDKD